MAERLGIVKAMRLRRRQDFLAVQRSGTKIHGRAFLALVAPSPQPSVDRGRLGVTVTKRVGNAVTRNRIKRLVREWLRCNGWVPAGCDVVLVAKEAAAQVRVLDDVAADLARLRERIGGLAIASGAPC